MSPDSNAIQIAVAQGGVIRLDQALECGLGTESITRRVRSGHWERISRSAYRLVDMGGPGQRVRAAVAVLPKAVASHETAAELHSIPRLPIGKAEVTVHSKTTHSFPGVTIHRTRDLADSHITAVGGLPVTTLARTIVDLAAQLHRRHLEAIVDDLTASRRLDIARLGDLVESVARKGKPGSATLRSLIRAREDRHVSIASRLERLGLAVLVDAGLPRPHIEYPAPWDETKRLDAAYPDAKVGIEWDSARWHTQVAAFQRDRVRDRQALLHYWRVFRFTWSDVTERPFEVASTIRTALDVPHPSK